MAVKVSRGANTATLLTVSAVVSLVTLALAGVTAVQADGDEAVVTLTDDTFKDFVESNQYVLAEFYAPWCGHCKSLAPEYEKAAQELKDHDPKVVLAKIDATVEKGLAQEFGIQGFPTLKWIVNGKTKEYTGGRTKDTIVTWVKKKTGPPANTIASPEELKKLKEDNEVAVVGFFDDDSQKEAFLKVAADMDEVPFGIAVAPSKDLLDAAEAKTPSIVVFQQFDEGKATFDGDLKDSEAIEKFAKVNSLPLIVHFTQQSAQKIFGGDHKQHLLLFVDKSDEATLERVKEAAKPVAKKTKGDILFVTVDKGDERVLEFFGVNGEKDIPTARIVQLGDSGMKKYKLPADEVTTETLDKFQQEYFEGKIDQDLKSEEIPESQDGDVQVLVGKNFHDIVKQPGKHVFVEFYAPWCGHCKKLEPIWEELGAKYKGVDNVVIAKMDSTANEVSDISISGFPTIKFFPADSEEVVDYDGGRELDAFVSFLEEKTGIKPPGDAAETATA